MFVLSLWGGIAMKTYEESNSLKLVYMPLYPVYVSKYHRSFMKLKKYWIDGLNVISFNLSHFFKKNLYCFSLSFHYFDFISSFSVKKDKISNVMNVDKIDKEQRMECGCSTAIISLTTFPFVNNVRCYKYIASRTIKTIPNSRWMVNNCWYNKSDSWISN